LEPPLLPPLGGHLVCLVLWLTSLSSLAVVVAAGQFQEEVALVDIELAQELQAVVLVPNLL
jgi:hypothetical protein